MNVFEVKCPKCKKTLNIDLLYNLLQFGGRVDQVVQCYRCNNCNIVFERIGEISWDTNILEGELYQSSAPTMIKEAGG